MDHIGVKLVWPKAHFIKARERRGLLGSHSQYRAVRPPDPPSWQNLSCESSSRTPVAVARAWGPEVGGTALGLRKAIRKGLGEKGSSSSRGPKQAHPRWISTAGWVGAFKLRPLTGVAGTTCCKTGLM